MASKYAFAESAVTGPRGSDVPKKDPSEVAVDANWEAYCRARDHGHLTYIKQAERHNRYYLGEQWDPADVAKLDEEGRPHQTVNLVLSTVNAVLGQYINNRQEIAFRPRGAGATASVAEALSSVVKQIQDNNKSRWVEMKVFADGVIEDRGYFDIRIDFSDNIFGEVRETAVNPREILLPPTACEYEPSEWPEVIRTRWLTLDEIAELYGKDKAEKLRSISRKECFGADSMDFDYESFGDESTFGTTPIPDTDAESDAISKIRVIERQHRKLQRRKFFVDLVQGDMRPVPEDWDEAKIAGFQMKFGLAIVERPMRRVRWTVSADRVLLMDDWSLYNDFTIVPFFPYFRRGRPSGLVRNLISPQDTLNKVTSQELHVVNTTANSGWIFEAGSLVDMDRSELERDGAKTGLVLEVMKGAAPPAKIEPNQVPNGLMQVSQKAEYHFRTISGVPEGMLGIVQRETSGSALEAQAARGLAQLEIVFDNLTKTRHLRAERILDLVQQFYTEERVVKVTTLDEIGEEVTEETVLNQYDEAGQIINNLTLGEYDVVVTSQQMNDVIQDTIFAQLMEMRDRGIPIPSHMIVANSRVPNRDQVAEVLKNLEGLADPTQEELEMQARTQMLQMEGLEANVRMMAAKAAEHEANAMLAMAKAGSEQQQPLLEAQKMGATMRADLEKFAAGIQQKREEMATRLQISSEKNEANKFVAQVQSMTKRVEALGEERKEAARLASQEKQAAMKLKAAAKKPAAKPKSSK
ncbi:MAG: hypothetical protein VKI63_02580 [Cyanobium sp.]|nr:hypothetical protein [Cyanobium sp.]